MCFSNSFVDSLELCFFTWRATRLLSPSFKTIICIFKFLILIFHRLSCALWSLLVIILTLFLREFRTRLFGCLLWTCSNSLVWRQTWFSWRWQRLFKVQLITRYLSLLSPSWHRRSTNIILWPFLHHLAIFRRTKLSTIKGGVFTWCSTRLRLKKTKRLSWPLRWVDGTLVTFGELDTGQLHSWNYCLDCEWWVEMSSTSVLK